MTKYKIKFTPLKPYTFFGESTFGNDDKQYYLQESRIMPQQTTVMGAVLELILKNKNLYQKDFKYTGDKLTEINNLIGGLHKDQLNLNEPWGLIEALSPVTIVNEQNQYMIANNYLDSSGKCKYRFEKTSNISSTISNEVCDLDVKSNPSGYINLDSEDIVETGDVVYDIQTNHVKLVYGDGSGVQSNYKKANTGDEGNYYVINKKMLKPGYAFQTELDIEFELEEQTTYINMGSKGSLFKVQISKILDEKTYSTQFEQYIEKVVKPILNDSGFEMIVNPTIIDLKVKSFVLGEKQSLRHYLKYNKDGVHNNAKYFNSGLGSQTMVQVYMPGSFLKYEKNCSKFSLKNGINVIERG